MYSYNSNHKVITALILIMGITLFHFLGKEEVEEERYYQNGQIKFVGPKKNEMNHGPWTWYYSNGQKMLEGKFVFGNREGIWTQYHTNGEVSMTSNYIENKLNGVLTTYDTSGVITSETEYRSDTIYKRLTASP